MIKLNCDVGESFGNWKIGLDSEILKHINMANIACGYHGGDPIVMDSTVKLAKKYSVAIGAHPGYPDLMGFGRRSMKCSTKEIQSYLIYQIGALEGFCKVNGVKLEYIKPHGALYNDMMANEDIFKAIVEAINLYNKELKLMILSSSKNSYYQEIAKDIKLIFEIFADRAYSSDGYLVPREVRGAVISDKSEVISQIKSLIEDGYLNSINGKKLYLKADSICVHGDNQNALNLTKSLRELLDGYGA